MKNHKLFLVLLLVLAVYLGLKTFPEDAWSGGLIGMASSQTMLTMRNWTEDGMVYSKFLLAAFGYSKITRYLDEPEMRHHAYGLGTGWMIGTRLYYTHYPPGYLIPYGILAKLGVQERHWFNLLALAFSLAALVLVYAFFCLIGSKTIAFLGVLYYAISTMFLGFADTLISQPIDDLFRFLILLMSILAVNSVSDPKKYKIFNAFIWLFYFMLALMTYDHTFFIFVWLVGLDIVTFRKFLWRKWLFFGTAPVAAFLLQMAQNMWYLGFHDMLLDIYGAFKFRASDGPGAGVLEKHIRAMFWPLASMTNLRTLLAIPVVSVTFLLFRKFRSKVAAYKLPKIEILFFLAVAGCIFPFIMSSLAYLPYQGRQAAPFAGLLLACSTVLIFYFFKNFKKYKAELSKFALVLFIVFVVLVGALWFFQVKRTYSYVREWPTFKVNKGIIDFTKSLKTIAEGKDPVVFWLSDGAEGRSTRYPQSRYPQIHPVLEYYMDMTVLSFINIPDLVHDFRWLENRSEFPFYPIILVNNQKEQEEVAKLLGGDSQISILIYPSLGTALFWK